MTMLRDNATSKAFDRSSLLDFFPVLLLNSFVSVNKKTIIMSENKVLNPTHKKIYEMISSGLKIDINKINPSSRFIDDLGADSLDLVEFVMALEEEFELDIPEDDAEKFLAVEDILSYIALKKTIN